MNVSIISTSYDRKSLIPLKSTVIDYMEITEDACYQPFVELMYSRIARDQTRMEDVPKLDEENNR